MSRKYVIALCVLATVLLLLAGYRLAAYGIYLDESGLGPASPYVDLLWLGLLVASLSMLCVVALCALRARRLGFVCVALLAASASVQAWVLLLAP